MEQSFYHSTFLVANKRKPALFNLEAKKKKKKFVGRVSHGIHKTFEETGLKKRWNQERQGPEQILP